MNTTIEAPATPTDIEAAAEDREYTFDELSPSAKERALDAHRYDSVEYNDWCGYILDEWKEKLAALGYDNPVINYSGFHSQGDGASFTASSVPSHDTDEAVKEAYTTYVNALVLLDGLAPDQIEELPNLASAKVKRYGYNYYHANTVSVNWTIYDSHLYEPDDDEIAEAVEPLAERLRGAIEAYYEGLTETVRDLCQEIYSELEDAYEADTSDEHLEDCFLANDYRFDEDGNDI